MTHHVLCFTKINVPRPMQQDALPFQTSPASLPAEILPLTDKVSRIISSIAHKNLWRFRGQHDYNDLYGILIVRWCEVRARLIESGDLPEPEQFERISGNAMNFYILDLIRQRCRAIDRGDTSVGVQLVETGGDNDGDSVTFEHFGQVVGSSMPGAAETEMLARLSEAPPVVQAFFKNAFERGITRRRHASGTREPYSAMMRRVAQSPNTDVRAAVEAWAGTSIV